MKEPHKVLLGWLLEQPYAPDSSGCRLIQIRGKRGLSAALGMNRGGVFLNAVKELRKQGYLVYDTEYVFTLRENPQPVKARERSILDTIEHVNKIDPFLARGLLEAHRLHAYYNGEIAEI